MEKFCTLNAGGSVLRQSRKGIFFATIFIISVVFSDGLNISSAKADSDSVDGANQPRASHRQNLQSFMGGSLANISTNGFGLSDNNGNNGTTSLIPEIISGISGTSELLLAENLANGNIADTSGARTQTIISIDESGNIILKNIKAEKQESSDNKPSENKKASSNSKRENEDSMLNDISPGAAQAIVNKNEYELLFASSISELMDLNLHGAEYRGAKE